MREVLDLTLTDVKRAERWKCKVLSCQQKTPKDPYCWINPKNDSHITITPDDLKLWAVVMLKDSSHRITIDECPPSIRTTLILKQKQAQKDAQKAPQRAPFGGQQQPQSVTPTLLSERELMQQYANFLRDKQTIDEYHGRQYGRPSFQPGYQADYQPEIDLRSSPVEGDLGEYIDWLKGHRQRWQRYMRYDIEPISYHIT